MKLFAKKSKLTINSFWTFSSSIMERGFTFITYALIARIISKDSYGIFLLAFSTVNVITTLLSSGTSLIITKQVAQNGDKEKEENMIILNSAFFLNIIIGGILLFIFFYFGKDLAYIISGEKNNSILIKQLNLIAPILLFQSLSTIVLAYLQGFQLFKTFTISNIFKGCSVLLFVVIALENSSNIDAVSIAFTTASALSLLFLVVLIVKKGIWNPSEFSIIKIKSRKALLLKYFYLAFPLILLSFVQIIGDWLAQIILTKSTKNWGAVAEFGVARQYAFILPMASAAITQGVLPLLSNKGKGTKNIFNFFKTSLLIQLILATTGLFFTPYLIPLIFGKDLIGAVIFAKTLIVSYTIFGVFGMIGPILLSKGKTKLLLIIQICRTVAILISVSILINIYDKVGIVYGYLLAEMITALIITIYFHHKILILMTELKTFLIKLIPMILLVNLLFFYESLLLGILFIIVFLFTCFALLKEYEN